MSVTASDYSSGVACVTREPFCRSAHGLGGLRVHDHLRFGRSCFTFRLDGGDNHELHPHVSDQMVRSVKRRHLVAAIDDHDGTPGPAYKHDARAMNPALNSGPICSSVAPHG
jgi:hypothetical protein